MYALAQYKSPCSQIILIIERYHQINFSDKGSNFQKFEEEAYVSVYERT